MGGERERYMGGRNVAIRKDPLQQRGKKSPQETAVKWSGGRKHRPGVGENRALFGRDGILFRTGSKLEGRKGTEHRTEKGKKREKIGGQEHDRR